MRADSFGKSAAVSMAVVGAVYSSIALPLSIRDRLWFDELFTYYFARLPDLGALWRQLETGVEQTPPFFYVLTRASLAAFGVSNLSLRLPAVIGVFLACACVFHLVARRSSMLHGVLAALILLATKPLEYAHEARPYGVVLGLAALAFLCWQLRGEGRRSNLAAVGMTVALALAVASHYYAVLLLLPLAMGEAARSAMRRRVDPIVWSGFVVALLPLLAVAPLIQAARSYSGTFWTEFGWTSAVDFYGWLLDTGALPVTLTRTDVALGGLVLVGVALHATVSPFWRRPGLQPRFARILDRRTAILGGGSAAAAAVVARAGGLLSDRDLVALFAATAAVLAYLAWRRRSPREGADPRAEDAHVVLPEVVAAAGFLVLPLATVAVATVATGAFTPRYALPAVLGLASLLPLALHRLDSDRRALTLVVACLLTVLVAGAALAQHNAISAHDHQRVRTVEFLERAAGDPNTPVAVSHALDFFELSHDRPRNLSSPLVHLASSEVSLRYTGSNVIEDAMLTLGRFAPLRVEPYEAYVASGRPFFVLTTPFDTNWLLPALVADGRDPRLRAREGDLALWYVPSDAGWEE